jgi:hypothetical protein
VLTVTPFLHLRPTRLGDKPDFLIPPGWLTWDLESIMMFLEELRATHEER